MCGVCSQAVPLECVCMCGVCSQATSAQDSNSAKNPGISEARGTNGPPLQPTGARTQPETASGCHDGLQLPACELEPHVRGRTTRRVWRNCKHSCDAHRRHLALTRESGVGELPGGVAWEEPQVQIATYCQSLPSGNDRVQRTASVIQDEVHCAWLHCSRCCITVCSLTFVHGYLHAAADKTQCHGQDTSANGVCIIISLHGCSAAL